MKFVYFFFIVLFITSCNKENPPEVQETEYFAKLLSGNQQSGLINQELDSPIIIEITDENGQNYSKANMSFLTPNGNLFSEFKLFSQPYYVHWLLGCSIGIQNALIVIKDSAEIPIDTINISATARKDPLWNRVCGLPLATDNGQFKFSPIAKFIKHPDGSLYTIAFPAAYSSLYVSSDNGESWSKKYTLNDYFRINDLTINNSGDFFMSAENGLFKSHDCISWIKIIDKPIARCFALDSKTLFACGSASPEIYRSDNNGETWNETIISYTKSNVIKYAEYILQAEKIGEDKILLFNGDLLISNDNGLSWNIFDNTTKFYISGFLVKNNIIYLATIAGPMIYMTDLDNISWTLLCTLKHHTFDPYQACEIYNYADNLFVLTDHCIYKIKQNGDTLNITTNIWSKIDGISKFIISANGNLVVGSEYKDNGVFYSKINVP